MEYIYFFEDPQLLDIDAPYESSWKENEEDFSFQEYIINPFYQFIKRICQDF